MKKFLIAIVAFVFIGNLSAQEEESEPIYTVVESMPVFKEFCDEFSGDLVIKCNMKEIQNYTATINYPQFLIDKNIQGKVYVRFIVDVDGSVIGVKLLRGVHYTLDELAIEHIKNMPDFFKPGTQNGKNVKVQYNIPIVFRANNKAMKLSKKDEIELEKNWGDYKKLMNF